MVLKELILNGLYFVKVLWSLNNIWEMHREALGTYKGVFDHMGASGGVQMHVGIQTYGVSTQGPQL